MVITGLGGETFRHACTAIHTIASIFDERFQEGTVIVRGEANAGTFPALQFGNRLLSRASNDNGDTHPSSVDIDPNGLLAGIGHGTFVHTEDNAVVYNERIMSNDQ